MHVQHKKHSPTKSIYLTYLKSINDINFTQREIDIISFLIAARSAKKIASFFSISPKTVENHTHNIMLKLTCNSREHIIDFVEKSGMLSTLRRYYETRLAESTFEKFLSDASKLLKDKSINCPVFYVEEEDLQDVLVSHLLSSLELAGIKIKLRQALPLAELPSHPPLLYIKPKQADQKALSEQDRSFFMGKGRILLFTQGKEPRSLFEICDKAEIITYSAHLDFYDSVICALKALAPQVNLAPLIEEFEKDYSHIEGLSDTKAPPTISTPTPPKKQFSRLQLGLFIAVFTLISLVGGGFLLERSLTSHEVVRSDLIVPSKGLLLNRRELISQIDQAFKAIDDPIPTIAFVGIGGAGKTTLARLYASSQSPSICWEINAETKGTLGESFEKLAHALAITEDNEKIIKGPLKLKDHKKRSKLLISFVKKRLKKNPGWLLIYDNVDNLQDISKYFPSDAENWGHGRVLLTTQNSTIENNTHVSKAITLGSLGEEQKLNLFLKIMANGKDGIFSPVQEKGAKAFLKDIPPFPLDVSVAAYYLRATNLSYKEYLNRVHENKNDLSALQGQILQGVSDYQKTRHKIITLPLSHLIASRPEFAQLFLIISVVNPQDIHRSLLTLSKDPQVVDDFIYNLRKYSLITITPSEDLNSLPSFSLHRSTQAIILAYFTEEKNNSKNKKLLEAFSLGLEKHMADIIEKEDFEEMRRLYHHTEYLLTHKGLLGEQAKKSLHGYLGSFYYYFRNAKRAKFHLTKSLESADQESPLNKNQVAHFLLYLANVHRSKGDYLKAEELYKKSLTIYQQNAQRTVGMARASGYLGATYRALGKFTLAKELLKTSQEIYKELPNNTIGLAWSKAHLGKISAILGEYEKARELLEESLSIYKKYSDNHVGASWVCGNLGDVYLKLNNPQRAKELFDESLSICAKHFSDNHVYYAQSLSHLGAYYAETGKVKKAHDLFKRALIIYEEVYGPNVLEVGNILILLSKLYLQEGQLKKAEETAERALPIFKKLNHFNAPLVLEILSDIHMKESQKGNFNTILQGPDKKKRAHALLYIQKALHLAKSYFSEESQHIKNLKKKLSTFY